MSCASRMPGLGHPWNHRSLDGAVHETQNLSPRSRGHRVAGPGDDRHADLVRGPVFTDEAGLPDRPDHHHRPDVSEVDRSGHRLSDRPEDHQGPDVPDLNGPRAGLSDRCGHVRAYWIGNFMSGGLN